MFGFFFSETPVRSYEDAKRTDVERFKTFFHTMLDRGVYFAPSAYEAGFVSYAHGGEALEHVISSLAGSMER
jgi:glutamate-1-semialdehyde 2,1-aminomutase